MYILSENITLFLAKYYKVWPDWYFDTTFLVITR